MASPIPIMASPRQMGTPVGSQKLLGQEDLPRQNDGEARKVQRAYLYGQIFHVAKMAVWWSMFGPLLLAAAPDTPGIIGYARLAFNGALMCFSPLAGALTAKVSIKATLVSTTILRGIVWGLLIPLTWYMTSQSIIGDTGTIVALLILNFIDGALVSIGNVMDVDCGGLDSLSNQHMLHVDDALRNRYNATWQGFFDGSFIIVNPAVAYAMFYISKQEVSAGSSENGILLCGIAAMFILLSIGSCFLYCRIPKLPAGRLENENASLGELLKVVSAGFHIVCSNTPVFTRLVLMGLETAAEDAMVSVILVELVLNSGMFVGPKDLAAGNLWVVCIVGVGKVGGVGASFLMKSWVPPVTRTDRGWVRLFVSIFISSAAVFLFPVAMSVFHAGGSTDSDKLFAQTICFVGATLFFFFSTAPKIGFSTLLQSLVAEQHAPQVFGFVGVFVTLMDGLVIMLVSQIFIWSADMQTALWIIAGIYGVHGALELLFGPCLVLRD